MIFRIWGRWSIPHRNNLLIYINKNRTAPIFPLFFQEKLQSHILINHPSEGSLPVTDKLVKLSNELDVDVDINPAIALSNAYKRKN